MSEQAQFNHESGTFIVNRPGGLFVGNSENTMLYLHDYEHRGADHIFIGYDEVDDNQRHGLFMFRIHSDVMMAYQFDALVTELTRREYEVYYADEIADSDRIMFEAQLEAFASLVPVDDIPTLGDLE